MVVMDINMPKMNGIAATRQIKTKWPETTIIGISVNIGDANSDAMKQAGAATLLTKEAVVNSFTVRLFRKSVRITGEEFLHDGRYQPGKVELRASVMWPIIHSLP